MSTDFTGIIPHGWSGGEAVTKWWRGKYVHLYRLHRECAQCGKEIVLDVTKAAITGHAKNAGLHLVRCPGCRAKTPRDITSRPTVRNEPMPEMVDDMVPVENGSTEIEALRMQNEMFLKSVQVLQKQLAEAEAKLASFTLQGAMTAQPPVKPAAPLTLEQSTALLAQNKMPWGS